MGIIFIPLFAFLLPFLSIKVFYFSFSQFLITSGIAFAIAIILALINGESEFQGHIFMPMGTGIFLGFIIGFVIYLPSLLS